MRDFATGRLSDRAGCGHLASQQGKGIVPRTFRLIILCASLVAVPAPAAVMRSEFFYLPLDEGWTLVTVQGGGVSVVSDGI